MPNTLHNCDNYELSPFGQAPTQSVDTFQTTICLYNDVTKQYEQYFKYVTTNPDNSQTNFYLYENLGAKLNNLPVGKVVPCVQDVHVVNDSGKIHETLDCNNEPAVKVFDKCTSDTLSKISSGIGQVSSGLVAVSSSLNVINSNVVGVNSTLDTINTKITNIDTQISSSLRPLIQQTRDNIADPALSKPENTVSLLAGVPTKILNATNRRAAIITWYSSTNPRAILNIGYNGSATINKGTALAFRQSEIIYGWMSKGEIWGVSSHDIVLNTVDFID